MKKVVIAVPHSHTYFWTQICLSSLLKFPPKFSNCSTTIVIVDNSPWSPAIKGVNETGLLEQFNKVVDKCVVVQNTKLNKFHASALDYVIENFDFDYLVALETDVTVSNSDWLGWFINQLKPTDYAVGAWHHEQFINPSCTLYTREVLYKMKEWCSKEAPQNELRWGNNFSQTAPLNDKLEVNNPTEILNDLKSWISGPFAEKRGWSEGTTLKETPSGQLKGPGWYEPGQQLHHWAVNSGYTYTISPTETEKRNDGIPLKTTYGENKAIHWWAGTRALDILKHPVNDRSIIDNTPFWLEREATMWKFIVPIDIQMDTIDLIRKNGWHTTGYFTTEVTDREHEAARFVQECYKKGGVEI